MRSVFGFHIQSAYIKHAEENKSCDKNDKQIKYAENMKYLDVTVTGQVLSLWITNPVSYCVTAASKRGCDCVNTFVNKDDCLLGCCAV
jgi:hypothetical protein